MKQTLSWFLAFMILFSSVSLIRSTGQGKESWQNPYIDVTKDMWSYLYITELNRVGALESQEKFNPSEPETRGDLVLALYQLDQGALKDREKEAGEGKGTPKFNDVPKDSPYYDAVNWAYDKGVVGGVSDDTFEPDGNVSREQVCTMLTRFAALEKISLIQVVEPKPFKDSLQVQEYARSGVTACQMAGIIKGYEDGRLRPGEKMTREECAAIVYRIFNSAGLQAPEGSKMVDLTPGAYDSLYTEYENMPFESEVSSGSEVDLSYFDETVFIGDSISLTLEYYANSSGALGNAQFLCAGSMSATNMLTGKILPEYPKGSGQKPPVEDSVAACGAQVVYIMLGMDNIAYGVERATSDMQKVIAKIQEKNPNVSIVIQSVTPMADSSTSKSEKLNNDTINAYNAKMLELCQQNRWYYLNVAEVFKDGNGYLKKEYCSDYGKMGMHFTFDGAKVWVEYLKTHVPDELQ
ncbi:MAG: S-layer homology domain-containing protein [Evtepia sp.]|uniref:S-layer homology domain-containing protein n=1 Tax=Evtepia sp. TaxID=2773933 RepID=UPI002A75D131|nr:S-layer homology domain-containing protein [Evtepia sp.]MDY3014984.1 S-layer homology domain-containing protein [Evtepia sp.]